jgi:hypothetical protein
MQSSEEGGPGAHQLSAAEKQEKADAAAKKKIETAASRHRCQRLCLRNPRSYAPPQAYGDIKYLQSHAESMQLYMMAHESEMSQFSGTICLRTSGPD